MDEPDSRMRRFKPPSCHRQSRRRYASQAASQGTRQATSQATSTSKPTSKSQASTLGQSRVRLWTYPYTLQCGCTETHPAETHLAASATATMTTCTAACAPVTTSFAANKSHRIAEVDVPRMNRVFRTSLSACAAAQTPVSAYAEATQGACAQVTLSGRVALVTRAQATQNSQVATATRAEAATALAAQATCQRDMAQARSLTITDEGGRIPWTRRSRRKRRSCST